MCIHCTRNMLGTTFVSHTQLWKTPQHRQHREKQENHVVSLSHREIAISSPFRDPPKHPRGIHIAWKCSNVHPLYPQYARNNFCQPHPALENTTTSSKSWKTRKSRCSHSQSHIGANSLPKAPMKMKKTSQRSYICVETLLFTPNVLGICLEQMLAHVWHLRKQFTRPKKNKNVVYIQGVLELPALSISLRKSSFLVISLFFTILTMLCCFPGLGVADKSCSEHIAGTMGAH